MGKQSDRKPAPAATVSIMIKSLGSIDRCDREEGAEQR